MASKALYAFLVSFAIGFVGGFAIGGAFGALFGAGLSPGVILGLLTGFVFGVLGLGLFYLAKALGRRGLLAIAAGLFILGIITLQPEVDVLALVPLAMALWFGTGQRR